MRRELGTEVQERSEPTVPIVGGAVTFRVLLRAMDESCSFERHPIDTVAVALSSTQVSVLVQEPS
jgi:hypothetical protein